ncbi:MAG: hypothetical protein QW815_07925 [Nitrososphaerota archaeon]
MGESRMGGKSIILGIWLIGFAIGFFAYLAYPLLADVLVYWLPQIFSDIRLVGAFLSGIAGSIITTVSVILWSHFSRKY